MAHDPKRPIPRREDFRRKVTLPEPDPGKKNDAMANDMRQLEEAGRRGSLFGKFNARFQDALQTSRGDEKTRDAVAETNNNPAVTADDLAMRRAKSVKSQRMVVPEGVIIEGSFSSGSETEISGRVDGDVMVEGRLFLGPSALVSGNVRAGTCSVEGLVEGKMECSEELDLGKTGRLNADAMAGKKMTVAGQVNGNVTCGGKLRLVASAQVTGNIRARSLVIEEGAVFNGACTMGTAKPRPKEG